MPAWLLAAAYYVNPQSFFYRPWEYFGTVVRRTTLFDWSWHGPRTGDLARQYYRLRNKPWTVKDTHDQFGYRAVPPPSDLPAILFLGDSYMAGSGLSDDQTVPWLVAQSLKLPVFNAAAVEYRIGALLGDPQMRCVQLVVDSRVDRLVATIKPYRGGRMKRHRRLPNPFWIIRSGPNIYALPAVIARYIRRRKADWFAGRNGLTAQIEAPQTKFIGDTIEAQDRAIRVVSNRRQGTVAARRRYIFLSLPDAGSVRVDKDWAGKEFEARASGSTASITQYERRNSARRIATKLRARNIHSIDLLTPFRHSYWHGNDLHFAHDSHWNAKGARLTAQLLSDLIEQKRLVLPADHKRCAR